jgi:HK97 family phage prohead protease
MTVGSRGGLPAGPQVRAYGAQFQVRSLAGSQVELTGYASVYDSPYEMNDQFGSYMETARSGMCAKTLKEGADVAYLANHEGLTMARTGAGTLALREDSTGLHTTATVNTARSDVRDLVTAIEDGAVDQMSFAFRIMRQDWNKPEYTERSLVEVNLDRGDVSTVNFGASPETSVSAIARAFRSYHPQRIHQMALELRAGATLSSATKTALSSILDLLAEADAGVDCADKNLDDAQEALSTLLGVPNPDPPDPKDMPSKDMPAPARDFSGYLNTLRRRQELDADRRFARS